MPPFQLLHDLRSCIRREHYSLRTEQTYVHWVKHYIGCHRPAPHRNCWDKLT